MDERDSYGVTEANTEYEERGQPSPRPGRSLSIWALIIVVLFAAAMIGWLYMHNGSAQPGSSNTGGAAISTRR